MTPIRIVVHCSATPNFRPYSALEIKKDHIENRGWADIGYHCVIGVDGSIENGRAEDRIGAHVQGANDGSLGVCLVGLDKFTTAQFKALKNWIEYARQKYNIPVYDVYCHHEFPSAQRQGKTCPNIRAANLVYWLHTGDWSPIAGYIKENG